MAILPPYRECLEAIRKLFDAYEEAISVSIGTDKYDNKEITFTIVKNNWKKEITNNGR